MTANSDVYKAFGKAFRAAFLLTGSTEVAENAVLGGIAGLEFGHITDDILVVETVRSVIQQRVHFPGRSEPAPSHLLSSFDGCLCLPRFLATLLYCEFSWEYLLRPAPRFCISRYAKSKRAVRRPARAAAPCSLQVNPARNYSDIGLVCGRGSTSA